MAGASSSPVFDFYLVLDFEATCDEKIKPKPQEIIEFPVLKVNSRTLETETEFHQYVCPTVHQQLSAFCTQLTGITQDMINNQPDLQTTMEMFDNWMRENGLLEPSCSSCFVTCGDWDLKTMLPGQCHYFGLMRPSYFNQWINIKKVYADVTKTSGKFGMVDMLQGLGLELIGWHHSGIDDCRNIARILKVLAEKTPQIKSTGSY